MEDWKNGRLEKWKIGKMEDWKNGRLEGLIYHFPNSNGECSKFKGSSGDITIH